MKVGAAYRARRNFDDYIPGMLDGRIGYRVHADVTFSMPTQCAHIFLHFPGLNHFSTGEGGRRSGDQNLATPTLSTRRCWNPALPVLQLGFGYASQAPDGTISAVLATG